MTTYRVWNGTSWEYIDNQNYDARYLLRSELGSNSGAASLDSGGHIPMVQVPSALTGAVNYQGTFNPIGGAPTPAGKGYYYVANTSGTVDATAFATGDWLIYTDSFTWEKLDNTGSSVIWEHVVDKPASYPPSSHNNSAHSETYLTTDGMAANSTLWDGIGRPLFTGNATKYMRLNEAGDAFEFATVDGTVDIHGTDSTSEFTTGDEVLIYDTSLGENRKILRGNFFNGLEGEYISIHGTVEETTPATNMEVLVYDPSVPANRRMTRANFLDGISAVGAFTDLTDTPASYEGCDETYYVRVNATSNALEFATVLSSYTLPTASAETLGGVKIGSGITITDGVISAEGGGGDTVEYITRTLEGVVYETTLMYWVCPATAIINSAAMYLSSNPSAASSYCKVQVMKNGLLETNSIFSSDTPMQVTEATSAVNGVYPGTVAEFDTGNNMDDLAAGDVLWFRVNQADTGSADLLVQIGVIFT
jgi:hypothetical protein